MRSTQTFLDSIDSKQDAIDGSTVLTVRTLCQYDLTCGDLVASSIYRGTVIGIQQAINRTIAAAMVLHHQYNPRRKRIRGGIPCRQVYRRNPRSMFSSIYVRWTRHRHRPRSECDELARWYECADLFYSGGLRRFVGRKKYIAWAKTLDLTPGVMSPPSVKLSAEERAAERIYYAAMSRRYSHREAELAAK